MENDREWDEVEETMKRNEEGEYQFDEAYTENERQAKYAIDAKYGFI